MTRYVYRTAAIVVMLQVGLAAIADEPRQKLPLNERLNLPVYTEDEELRLSDLLAEVAEQSGVSIVADWEALAAADITEDTESSLQVWPHYRIDAGRFLELALHEAGSGGLAIVVDAEKGLHVTTVARADELERQTPERWARWQAKPAETPGKRTSSSKQTKEYLAADVPWNFDENRLVNVLDYLRNVSGANFYVDWRALNAIGVDQDAGVTGAGKAVATERVLGFVLGSIDRRLTWRIDPFGVVIVSTKDRIDILAPESK